MSHLQHHPKRRRWDRAGFIIASALLVPAVGWTASVPHSDFAAGDPISASQMNENFAALVEQVSELEARSPGVAVVSEPSGHFITMSTLPVAVPGNAVVISTGGGVVRLELAGAPGANSMVWLRGAGAPAQPWLWAAVRWERSDDGATWEDLGATSLGGAPNPVQSTLLPPSAFAWLDEPPAGRWYYRVTVQSMADTGCEAIVENVRLVAREIGAAP